MVKRIFATAGLLHALCLDAPAQTSQMAAAEGFHLEQMLSYPALESFTWDERGTMWILSAPPNRLALSSVLPFKNVQPLRSWPRLGNGRASLLVTGKTAFVADGEAMHRFSMEDSRDLELLAPPRSLFPASLEIGSLAWAPLGHIYFLYHSSVRRERGIGRVSLDGQQWDVVAKGSFANFAFDPNGFVIAADSVSGALFRVASGLDYDRGLETYTKADLALKTDRPGLQPAFTTIYSGSAWPPENHGAWLVLDSASSSLEQFVEENGALRRWRTVARFSPQSELRDLQVGPDGAAWLLAAPAKDRGDKQNREIFRLTTGEAGKQSAPLDLLSLDDERLVSELGSANSWRRDAAMRLLDSREDLRTKRGLHPRTPMNEAFSDKTNSPAMRAFAMLSLHRLGLLDETFLENAADDEQLVVRAWAGLLLGERNYPTSVAFHKLMKLAKETNLVARSAAAIGARQFVSGSLAIDVPPRAMPLREVSTGGILSTLWFSTENGSSPEFDLLFWNAVRPITAFDHAHPMGFFNGDNDSKLALAYWIVGLITRQIAESDHPLKQEEAMIMVSELDPKNPKMIIAALLGMKNAIRRVTPTERSIQVLADFANSDHAEIASLAKDLRTEWQMPFK